MKLNSNNHVRTTTLAVTLSVACSIIASLLVTFAFYKSSSVDMRKNTEGFTVPSTTEKPKGYTSSSTNETTSQSPSCDALSEAPYTSSLVESGSIESFGTVKLYGKLVLKTMPDPWTPEIKDSRLFFAVEAPNTANEKAFFDHYYEIAAGGNTINYIDGKKLLFNLGIVVDGKIKSSATISSEVSKALINKAATNDLVALRLTIPSMGREGSVGSDFSFACQVGL